MNICLATHAGSRPRRNGTYVEVFDSANSTLVWARDCGFSPDCIYSGQTLLFYVSNAMWTPGTSYYILFGSGVVSDDIFCGLESAPVTGWYSSLFLRHEYQFLLFSLLCYFSRARSNILDF